MRPNNIDGIGEPEGYAGIQKCKEELYPDCFPFYFTTVIKHILFYVATLFVTWFVILRSLVCIPRYYMIYHDYCVYHCCMNLVRTQLRVLIHDLS